MQEVSLYLIITKLIWLIFILTLTELNNQVEDLLYNLTIIFHLNCAILLEITPVTQMEEVFLYLIITKLI
jgi:hypothetical protein